MPIAWTESLTLRLVTLYSKHECLRNPFHPNFRNKLCRYKAYKEIVNSMNVCGLTVCDCIKRITYVKAQYCYELSKISAAISCEKFYSPTMSWFPIVHQLFFPFIATYSDTCEKYDDKKDTFKNYCDEICDQYRIRSNSVEQKVLNKDYNYSYATCYCDKSNIIKPRTRIKKLEKSFFIPDEHKEPTDCKNYLYTQKIARNDVANNTKKNINTEHATQTEISYFKTACTTCQVCTENEISNTANLMTIMMKNDPKDIGCIDYILAENDIKEARKIDEFDMFGKSIAFQLRNISFEVAIKLEKHIQDLITQERLDNMKSRYLDCYTSSTCSECTLLHKEITCSCGLPVIKIKTDSSYEFDCKQWK
ncbi:uncharacterized protein LOC100867011 [Apis florea]|uniref:uncharacterized protein LOC100867011 n=1 Tax=Apis florea TaxID=7463 RepID=UPI000252B43E|nr:uncharacterized protein LOC100867011 [Apis florea]